MGLFDRLLKDKPLPPLELSDWKAEKAIHTPLSDESNTRRMKGSSRLEKSFIQLYKRRGMSTDEINTELERVRNLN